MTPHPEHINPDLAKKRCTPAELEVVMMRNYQPPMSWTMIGAATGTTCGEAKRIWGDANRKTNGGYVPSRSSKEERELERLKLLADPDIKRGLAGIPTVGLSKPGAAIIPGKPTRSGKVGS